MIKEKKIGIWLLITAIVALFVAACGPAVPSDEPVDDHSDAEMSEEAESEEDVMEETEEEVKAPTSAEEPSFPAETAVESGDLPDMEIIEVEAGTGVTPLVGDLVRVHYTGFLDDGTIFDSSLDSGIPFEFVAGQRRVIPGWDQGILNMQEGGKATWIIPPHLGYGPAGSGPIPPNATLTFEVELIEVVRPEEIAEADYEVTESGLLYHDLVEGTGDIPQENDVVTFLFLAWLEDGTHLGGTNPAGGPATVQIGTGEPFAGFDESLSTMKAGGTRQTIVPSELAFGEEGANGIPPGASIILSMEVLSIETPPPPPEPAEFPNIDELELQTTDSGLQYYIIEEGDGPVAQPGQQVSVHYTGWLVDGTQFDSSIDGGVPFNIMLGAGQVIPGWDEGIALMSVGSKAILVIPPELGYGATGFAPVIPPDATLVFEVNLVDAQ